MSFSAFPHLQTKRFVVHAGASKTGTTALQTLCAENRDRLLTRGVWYPQVPGDSPFKHQWLVDTLLAGDRPGFLAALRHLDRHCPPEAHTVFLSTEGLSYHWARFGAEARALLAEFVAAFAPTCVYVTREREALLPSFYKQCLINPRRPEAPEFGTAETMAQWLERPHVQASTDCEAILADYRALFGADRVEARRYSKQIVNELVELVSGAPAGADWHTDRKANVSVSDVEAELIRLLNGLGLADVHRRALVAHFKDGQPDALPPASDAALREALARVDVTLVQAAPLFAPDALEVARLRDRLLGATPATPERRTVPEPGRVLFGCVADNKPKYLTEAVRLVESLRWFGGSLADAPFVVGAVGEMDPAYRERLEELGAVIREIPRFTTAHGPSNKLSLLEHVLEAGAELEYETFVLLDCDTAVLQDPAPWLEGGAFRAKIADLATVPHATFERLFAHFGLPVPPQAHRTQPGDQPTIWYCNAGVLVFPRAVLRSLVPAWLYWNRQLLDQLELLGEDRFFCEQASLSLAFAETPVPFSPLPLVMNYPLHLGAAMPQLAAPADPVIVHYHDRVTPHGYLSGAPNATCQARLDGYNQRVSGERRGRFDNRLFWNFRYAHAPELGSGVGSRGAIAEYKRAMLQRIMGEAAPATVLDVGCGDQHVSSALPSSGYLGLDISSVVVEKNRESSPQRRFECRDMLDPAYEPPLSDAVVCLDVLIHLDDADRYRRFVRRLVTATGRFGVVSGYESDPCLASDMVFYHEPLSQTLREAGATRLEKVGAYDHGITVWRFERESVAVAPGLEAASLPVVIAGMHRSGTSMTASFMQALGVNIGEKLMAANQHNKPGYFEDLEFYDLQRQMLRAACAREAGWVEVGWTESEALDEAALAAFEPTARALIDARRDQPVWGWKDPRTTILLPFWQRLLPEARYLMVYRRPWDVVDSLFRAGHAVFEHNPEYAIRIWTFYNRRMLDFYRANRDRCVLVSTEGMLEQLDHFVSLLASKLGLRIEASSPQEALASIYDASLLKALPLDHPYVAFASLYPEAMAVYRALEAEADIASAGLGAAPLPSGERLAYQLYRQAGAVPAPTAERRVEAAPAESPLCSIVVPVFNKAEYTKLCIESLFENTPRELYELILVDNASTDDTAEMLAALGDLATVITNATNLGFAKACNQGARAAKGRYVVFLNNDTVPLEGWLENLVAEAEADPRVGVVGCKLLYPNDRIQHAGMAFVDPYPMHVLLNMPQNDPAANVRRELDMVTGAVMLLPAQVCRELGGFDEGYLNSYEDVDLCLRARVAGYTVRYTPHSVLYHFESVTPGRHDHNLPNHRRFLQRWRHAFDDHGTFHPERGMAQNLPASGAQIPVRWVGDIHGHHSLALVNRAITDRLIASGTIELERFGEPVLSRPAAVQVRHQWPPDFRPPAEGAWVVCQPWEFGGLPAEWVAPLRDQVDELWCYSHYLRECAIASGVPADRVKVVPLGVDAERFSPEGPLYPLKTDKRFKFLFVGGAIARKGLETLLATYMATFTAQDDVCLVIKAFGNGTVYHESDMEQAIARMREENPRFPEIEYLDADLPDSAMPGLYRACDVLVHPYRAEGFGLPIAEAMAAGLPVIVTGHGAALDFCNAENSYLIPASLVPLAERRELPEPSAPGYFWAEPDPDAMSRLMRHVVADPAAAAAVGRRGRATILGRFGWEATAVAVTERLTALATVTPRRFGSAPMPLDGARRVTFFHHPDWASGSWQPVLEAYMQAFGAEDDTTLVLWLDPAQGCSLDEVAGPIAAMLDARGDGAPDVLLVPDALDEQGLASLHAAIDWFVPPVPALHAGRVLASLAPEAWRVAASMRSRAAVTP